MAEYTGPERRATNRGRREDNGHCLAHVFNMERIAKLETREDSQDEKFDTIFDKLDVQGETLRCIKSNQEIILVKFSKFEEGYDERVETSNAVISEYRQAMIGINNKFVTIGEKFAELDSFKWYRDWMNGIRDGTPKFLFKWIMITAGTVTGLLLLIHWMDIPRILRLWGIIK
jgi:hypothetical protein